MPDYPDDPFEETLPPRSDGEEPHIPASVIFTEMMRQAAARRSPADPAPPQQDEFEAAPPLRDYAISENVYVPLPEQPRPERRRNTQRTRQAKPAPSPQEVEYDEALEQQRIRRIKRRQERRRRRAVGVAGGFIRTALVVLISAVLASTIFTYFTDPSFLGQRVTSGLQVANATGQAPAAPTEAASTPNWLKLVGIVSGHRGPENDPGAVCPDGLTEAEINFNVAQRVVNNLRELGYQVDLLDEFDPRLNDYQAAALVSIHANTCQDFGEVVSGYLVAKAAARPEGGLDEVLAECVALYYEQAVSLERRFSLTVDMTNYHTFREIHPLTPAAIIELGFMLHDRELLTNQPDLMAMGITNGILCFLEPERQGLPTSTPAPESAS